MGRSQTDIEQSLKDSFAAINPSLDLVVGPTWDYTLAPIPKELALVEQAVTDLQVFYSPDFPSIATPVQAREMATSFGISVSIGERARGIVTFFRYTPPPSGASLRVSVGQLVGTRDLQFLFQTLESKTMLGNFAATYYNPETQRYEMSLLVQAVLPGSLYNLPAQRIDSLVSQTGDFNGVFQPADMDGGTEPETAKDLAERTIDQFKGVNLNSIIGLDTLAKRYKPTLVLDTHTIKPTDRKEFRRPTSGPAIDMCVLGSESLTFTEEYLAVGGETSIPLVTSTATSVAQVQINNSLLDPTLWVFAPDTTPAYQGSTRATNRIEFYIPLVADDIVTVSGTQNFLLDQLQALVSPDEDAIFKTDALVRGFVNLPVTVGVTVRIHNTAVVNVANLDAQLRLTVQDYIEQIPIPSSLSANTLSDQIKASLPNVQSINIYQMRRTTKSVATVETIQPLKNERPIFDEATSSLAIKV